MSTINYPNPRTDLTVKIFDNFYIFATEVPVDQYDVVFTYFETVFGDKLAAENFTITLFQISQSTAIPVLTLLDEIRGLDQIRLTSTLAYYLNNQRSNSTLLGINALVTPNFYAARNVLP